MAVVLAILKNLYVNLVLNGCVFDNIGCIFPVSGCKNANVGCIYGSYSLYDCIIGRGLYTLINIHPDVFLPVIKMPCTCIILFLYLEQCRILPELLPHCHPLQTFLS